MANERLSSSLIDEGTGRPADFGSLTRTMVGGLVLTVCGVVLVCLLFFLLAQA
jgi:hypothetical protein